ncbi:uncharacterized protein LOC101213824 isoform X3 [Cucumis sativus]|uniref:uncharacterized protein LOC101213824 isoform X3 n=1 Tax=Cucumis sativus TaxID=3659 RepID=UPI0012F4E696|nr:uncharacterized protein LOC101213824 isoform X3 [Cucumis sativus]
MLKAKGLRKAVVPSILIDNPSPGNIQPTRLALHVSPDGSSCWVFIASGSRVFKLQISMDESSVLEGKDSLLIPVQTKVLDSLLLNRCPHRSEIQSLVLAEVDSSSDQLLGTVDSYGHLIVSKLDATGKDADRFTYSVLPRDSGLGEGSWAGLCFSPSELSTAAVAHSFGKTVDVYDQDVHVRTLRTLLYPTALTFIQNPSFGNGSSVLAVTEGCQLTIWDLRMKEKGGCLQRICGSIGDNFYAVCTSSNGNIAVGGADRTVTIYDPRRLRDCLSHQLTLIAFMSRELTMRPFVDSGKNAINYFH